MVYTEMFLLLLLLGFCLGCSWETSPNLLFGSGEGTLQRGGKDGKEEDEMKGEVKESEKRKGKKNFEGRKEEKRERKEREREEEKRRNEKKKGRK